MYSSATLPNRQPAVPPLWQAMLMVPAISLDVIVFILSLMTAATMPCGSLLGPKHDIPPEKSLGNLCDILAEVDMETLVESSVEAAKTAESMKEHYDLLKKGLKDADDEYQKAKSTYNEFATQTRTLRSIFCAADRKERNQALKTAREAFRNACKAAIFKLLEEAKKEVWEACEKTPAVKDMSDVLKKFEDSNPEKFAEMSKDAIDAFPMHV